MLQPKYLKEGKLLQKGVKKFVRYKRDLITDERMAAIDASAARHAEALEQRDPEQVEKLAKELTTTCEKSVPAYRSSAWAENVEVVFVAIVIALGVRAYFFQPFKIPTGSMQPTLNGVVATVGGEDFAAPGAAGTFFDRAVRGRTWVDLVAEEDDEIVSIEQRTKYKFFTATRITCRSGKVYSVAAPFEKLIPLGLAEAVGSVYAPPNTKNVWLPRTLPQRPGEGDRPPRIRKGQVLARGRVDTGDQVLVDKFSYHFRSPKRGEVFVFTTKNLNGITMDDPRGGSQHYIKRLVAVPEDEVFVNVPNLYINGEVAKEKGMRRVMERENGYPGYTTQGSFLLHQPGATYKLEPDEFWAMGDNSPHSSDSREWGPVPRDNLVGPALFVYWPFTSHWGKID